jgi:hypothetical protein
MRKPHHCVLSLLIASTTLAPRTQAAPSQYSFEGRTLGCAGPLSDTGTDAVGVATLDFAGTNHGDATEAPAQRSSLPCPLVIGDDLRPFAQLAWDHSATFRKQCRTLGAARATVIVHSASSREIYRADARISVSSEGTIFARVRVRDDINPVELIAHELEHVLERVEGVNLLMESRGGGSRVTLSRSAFETRRAIEAGRRVAQEVHEATRALTKPR